MGYFWVCLNFSFSMLPSKTLFWGLLPKSIPGQHALLNHIEIRMETSSDRKSGGTPMFMFPETTCRKSKYMILLLDMDRSKTILMSFQEVQ